MRKLIFFFIIIQFSLIVRAQQDSTNRKMPVWSTGIRNVYAVLPLYYSFGINSPNLRNNLSLTYNNRHNYRTNTFKRPGIQVGYNRYFLKRTGPLLGLSYNYIFGEFGYSNGQKYNSYIHFKNLEYLNLNFGFYYRINFRKFGILEPSITLSYFYPTRSSNYRNYFEYSTNPRLIPNLELKYYFKRNKVKQ
jgi:hypothetical protein